jgi:group I intron endonuclease
MKNNYQDNKTKIIPILTYNDVENNKYNIYKENRNKSGIYRWVNKINNKSYIGSAVNLSQRLKIYYSLNALKRIVAKESSHIYNGILKYGYNNYKLEILEYCDKEFLINREQYYIDLFKPEYNILKKAGSRLGHKASYATRKLMSIVSRGRKFPRTELRIRSKINVNNTPKVITSDTKLKLSLRGQGVNVKVFDKENNLIYSFPSLVTAAKHLGVRPETISKILNKGISYDEYIYNFEVKDLRIWIYNPNYELMEVFENAKKVSIAYNIPRSTLSNYIKSGKLYKNKFYFLTKEYKNN